MANEGSTKPTYSELEAENLRVRGLLQRAKELLRKSINTTSFFDEDVQKQILEFLAGSAETGGEKAAPQFFNCSFQCKCGQVYELVQDGNKVGMRPMEAK